MIGSAELKPGFGTHPAVEVSYCCHLMLYHLLCLVGSQEEDVWALTRGATTAMAAARNAYLVMLVKDVARAECRNESCKLLRSSVKEGSKYV
jgi:hypothetical protein